MQIGTAGRRRQPHLSGVSRPGRGARARPHGRPDGQASASRSTSTCCSPASEPTEEQRFFLDLLLVAIAEHGMMPTNVAARMTLAADPGSLQGAVAAGILGCGPVDPRHGRGVRAAARARRRRSSRRAAIRPRSPATVARAIHAAGKQGAGIRPPGAPPLDPRAERILELADERGVSGAHVLLARELRDAVARRVGQAADDERLAADRRGAARPRLPGRDGEGDAAARAHGRPARPPRRGAGAPDRAS